MDAEWHYQCCNPEDQGRIGDVRANGITDGQAGVALPGRPLLETRISGAEVPKLTIVKPMIRGEIFRLNARALAPTTKRSALQVSRTNPPAIASNSSNMRCLARIMNGGLHLSGCLQAYPAGVNAADWT